MKEEAFPRLDLVRKAFLSLARSSPDGWIRPAAVARHLELHVAAVSPYLIELARRGIAVRLSRINDVRYRLPDVVTRAGE